MNEAAKQAYLDKSAAQLREWGAKIEVIKAQFAQGVAGARIDYHQQMERWQVQESAFKQKIEDLRSVGTEGFESMKAHAQTAWNEISILIAKLEEKSN